jgi:hypothetical protein
MPKWSVWSVRSALIWLALAAAVGAGLLSRDRLGLPGLARLIPAHAEMMLVGWMMQLAFGVAYWILPGRERRDPRRVTAPLIVVSLALNGGIVAFLAGATLAGRLLEGGAALVFVTQVAPRIRGVQWGATGRGGDLVRLAKEMPRS